MCGIAGILDLTPTRSAERLGAEAVAMADRLVHRGPDDAGVWVDAAAGVALAHRRLSIVDLSPQGHQPMLSVGGDLVLAYNGEIYNFEEVRAALTAEGQAPAWRGHSDTEVLLAALAHWGVERTLQKCVGMFAFALWDRAQRTLTLARDRMGEKPLYYGRVGDRIVFASELKALKAQSVWSGDIDRDALTLFLRYSYVPAPYSIYQGIRKLMPGSVLVLAAGSPAAAGAARPTPYWSVTDAVRLGTPARNAPGAGDPVDELDALLRRSVSQQMVSDVPLGAFLSGGIDSSTVVALMQAQSARPIETFTIGFHERGYDEAQHAKAVAAHIGTHHTEWYVTSAEVLDAIPRMAGVYDEPFADPSQIPTYLLAHLTRRAVTVALTGDGGDELFAGYPRYTECDRAWSALRSFPPSLRRGAAQVLAGIPTRAWDVPLRLLGKAVPARVLRQDPGDKVHKFARIMGAGSALELYRGFISHWRPGELTPGTVEPASAFDGGDWSTESALPIEAMMCLDMLTYLPDDILAKVDRAGMAASLETRLPLLDHRIVEFAWRTPLDRKIRDGRQKWLLRAVLDRYVPRELIDRPKMGFSIPLDQWLRGPLRDWAEHLLDERAIADAGHLDPRLLRARWNEHLSGARNWQYYLWDVLMFQAWLAAE